MSTDPAPRAKHRTPLDVFGDYIEVTCVERGGETYVDVAIHSPGSDTHRSAGVEVGDRVALANAVLSGTDHVAIEERTLAEVYAALDAVGQGGALRGLKARLLAALAAARDARASDEALDQQ